MAFDFDYWLELPGDDGRGEWKPYAPNSEGLFFYIRTTGDPLPLKPFATATEAKTWADAQPWAPALAISGIGETLPGYARAGQYQSMSPFTPSLRKEAWSRRRAQHNHNMLVCSTIFGSGSQAANSLDELFERVE